jgi:hypothetical protein
MKNSNVKKKVIASIGNNLRNLAANTLARIRHI